MKVLPTTAMALMLGHLATAIKLLTVQVLLMSAMPHLTRLVMQVTVSQFNSSSALHSYSANALLVEANSNMVHVVTVCSSDDSIVLSIVTKFSVFPSVCFSLLP